MTKQVDYFLRSIVTEFDTGYFTKSPEIKKSFQYESMFERISLGSSSQPFFQFNLRMNKVETLNFVSYAKV